MMMMMMMVIIVSIDDTMKPSDSFFLVLPFDPRKIFKIEQRLETRNVITAIWKFNLSKTDRGHEVPNRSGIK
jgi:hypothetical protein